MKNRNHKPGQLRLIVDERGAAYLADADGNKLPRVSKTIVYQDWQMAREGEASLYCSVIVNAHGGHLLDDAVFAKDDNETLVYNGKELVVDNMMLEIPHPSEACVAHIRTTVSLDTTT